MTLTPSLSPNYYACDDIRIKGTSPTAIQYIPRFTFNMGYHLEPIHGCTEGNKASALSRIRELRTGPQYRIGRFH